MTSITPSTHNVSLPSPLRRRLLLCGLFAAAMAPWLVAPAPVVAQAEDPDAPRPMSFKTSDDVTLQGQLYKSKKGSNSPVVIVLPGAYDDPTKGGAKGLASDLRDKGFHVFRFDYRGRGQSTLINASKFWADPINAQFMSKQARAKPPRGKLEFDDYKMKSNYFPRLAEDVMAARVALDQLNDNGEVNTSSVYLIGAKDAATYGFLYLAAEWSRSQKMQNPTIYGLTQFPALVPRRQTLPVLVPTEPAGWDVAGAVWLSAERHPSVPLATLQSWVQSATEMRERTPMLFLYGADDVRHKNEANDYVNRVLGAKVAGSSLPALPLTRGVPIEKTKLVGAELLGKSLGTEKLISDYLEALEKERKNLIRITNRGYTTAPPINLQAFGVCRP